MNSEEALVACQEIMDNCVDCGLCRSECQLLQRINESLVSLAIRQPTVTEAYNCSLCGLCESVCPSDLSPKYMFAAIREKSVAEGEIDIEDFRYMFPDRPLNVMKLYREVNGIGYGELNPDREADTAFFAGCSMLTYAPQLVHVLFKTLQQQDQGVSLLTDCCGLPLYQLGLKEREARFIQGLKDKLRRLKVKKLIFACPNCYYQLQSMALEMGIAIQTIYEALEDSELVNVPLEEQHRKVVTVHDSCPDRAAGKFAGQARKALALKGYSLVEMEHNRDRALCCGSGGQVSHFDPELAQSLVQARLREVEASEAEILAAYCLGCVLNLSKNQNQIPVQHVLNLLLEFEQDFVGLKRRAQSLFEGPEGEKLWERIMAD
ncbi:(Fe-S)-binding protein [Desulfitobacterium sp. PCE1]|uniref:(Fe-S)-binding protein n=1 Tax=Desulfitobacterium sp. PCE1 TaxID=146907 RepID=UPI000371C9EF|nr:(Fe-S)-binding protein [Desulfitobacterium sp. PCE1]